MATESLIKSGYKRIAHISGPQHIKAFSDRVKGYNDALAKYNLTAHSQLIYSGDVSINAGRLGVQHYWV